MKFERKVDPKSSMSIGRGRYSKKEFPGYRYRAHVRFTFKVNQRRADTSVDVYTDRETQEEVIKELWSRAHERVVSIDIESWISKLEDELFAAFIEETLKDL